MDPEETNPNVEGAAEESHPSPLIKKRKADDTPTKSHKKQSKVTGIDDEASESGEEESGSDNDESVDEEDNYKFNEFLVPDDAKDTDDEEEEEKVIAKPKSKLKKLKKARAAVHLDEEDELLIQENIEQQVEDLPADEEDDVNGDGEEIVPEMTRDDPDSFNEIQKEKRRNFFEQQEIDDGSDMDDFIVQDEVSVDGEETEEARLQRMRIQHSQRRQGKRDGPTFDQIQEAMDIFGAGYDSGFDDDAEPEDEDDEDVAAGGALGGDSDDEGGAGGAGGEAVAKLSSKDKKLINKMRSRYERAQLVASFCTDRDEELRNVDVPERFQSIMKGRGVPDDEERSRESQWMAEKLAVKIAEEQRLKRQQQQGAFSYTSQFGNNDLNVDILRNQLAEPIQAVLKFFQVDRFEVPFVWLYRRDYLHPQMTRNHLWYLLDLDQQWEVLFVLNSNLQQTITALDDAAHSSSEQDEEEKVRMAAEVEFQVGLLRDLLEEVRAAEEREKELMDYVDNNDDHTQEDRDRVTDATENLEALRAKLPPLEEEVRKVKESAEVLNQRILRKAKYSPAAAAEVMRLFPKERYEVMMHLATDEVEIRDISRFLSTLMQGAEGGAAGADVGVTQQSEGPADGFTQGTTTGGAAGSDRRNNISKRSEYTKYKNLPGVRAFAEWVCLPACELGDSLRMNMKSEPKATGSASADEIAIQFVDDNLLRSEQKVIQAACVVIATELSVEPTVRRLAREFFKHKALVTTRPTEKGVTAITPFSEYFGIHYLDNKPLSDFYESKDRTLFIRLMEAEKEGLLTVTVQLPQAMQQNNHMGNDVRELFVRLMRVVMPSSKPDQDSHRDARQSWDTVRITALSQCIEKYLLPSLLSECKRDLLRIGKETIVEEAASNFEKMLKVGPYRVPNQDGRAYTAELLRSCPNGPPRSSVMSIYQSVGDPLFMAFVDKDGVLRAHDLLPAEAANQKVGRIKKFILDNKPGLIVLNASAGYNARSLSLQIEKNILKEVGETLEQQYRARQEQRELDEYQHHRDQDEEEGPFVPYRVEVLIVKDEVANIFKGSSRAKTLLPELQPGGAAAVCLARFMQEPLSEYCNIWTSANAVEVFGYEALFLNLHPLKNLLQGAKTSLLKMMEYKLINAVCDVGVDINKAVAMDHHAALLAFVGGLGLRKADALRQNVRRTLGTVVSRNSLLVRKLLGKNVWANSSGFIRICDNGQEKDLDPLDNTRIHPECYVTFDFAPKICADALEVDNNPADYVDIVERLMQQCQRELERRIRKHPRWLDLFENGEFPVDGVTEFNEKIRLADGKEVPLSIELHDSLSQLLLDEFAQDLEMQKKGKRRLQLQHIKDELRFPWLDLRASVRGISANEFFSILTGETDTSLYVGLKLGCTVLEISDSSFFDERTNTHKRRQRAVVKTDNGLRGYISVYDAFDAEQYFDYDSVNLSKFVQVGMHMLAVVIGVKKDKLQVDLSIKPSHLGTNEAWWLQRRSVERPIKEWWEQCRKDFQFDRYFNEQEALDRFTSAESSQIRTSQAVGAQMSAVSLADKSGTSAGVAGGTKMAMRMVHHPLFANLDFKATEERMRFEGKGAGEVLIRPSSKGPDYLTITWAFQTGWYKHISVQERGKRPGDLGLGSQLIVMEPDMQKEVYSDLDEIHARYIEPMNEFVTMMIHHRNFMSGSVEEVEAEMRLQLSERPGRIPYFVRFEPTRPGAFVLTWLSLNVRSEVPVKKELIEVRPYGYKIRNEVFSRPSDLIMWFKTTTEAAAAAAATKARQQPPVPPIHQQGGDGGRRVSRFGHIDRNTVAANNTYGQNQQQMPMQQGYGNQQQYRNY